MSLPGDTTLDGQLSQLDGDPNEAPLDSVEQLPQPNEAPLDNVGQLPQPNEAPLDRVGQLPQPNDAPLDRVGQLPESNDAPLDTPEKLPRPAQEPKDLFAEVDQPVFNLDQPIIISCHCNRVNGTIKALPLRAFSNGGRVKISIDHDSRARKFSGQLAVTYFPSLQPEPYTLAKTVCFRLGNLDRLNSPTFYFCPTCGCHLFKEEWETVAGSLGPTWAVATGVAEGKPKKLHSFVIGQHINVDQTGDGGLSIWMRARKNDSLFPTDMQPTDMPPQNNTSLPLDDYAPWSPTPTTNPSSSGHTSSDTLDASCFCGTVKFHITRPNSESWLPRSQLPDLIFPYHSKSEIISNPYDSKWWIRGNRYLAGTCACTSCRRCSGFDIQSWAFIPRANIFMHHSDKHLGLDFSNLPKGILRSYSSSPGVTREFCPGCGATVFWHNTDRPELIDVSVGLFNAKGARAEDWLHWWTKRVSFAEDRDESRGLVWNPVKCLEVGLLASTKAGV
jgi:hypothetical protein